MKKNHIDKNRMLKLYPFLIVLLSLVSGCNPNGFEQHSSGLLYRVLNESESQIELRTGDYVELEFAYYTETDSLLFHSGEFGGYLKMQISENSHKGGCFEDALTLMNPGDKYIFIIPTDSFYAKTKKSPIPEGVKPGTNLYFNIHVIRKVPEVVINREKELLIKQMEKQEKVLLEQFISDNNIKTPPTKSGLYIIVTEEGKGKKAIANEQIAVHYTGKLLDGKIFDSSYKRKEPFVFRLGAEEAIKGWDEAFLGMRKGTKATLIIPSDLAYGKEGYASIIPPYSSLIFEIELIDDKKK